MTLTLASAETIIAKTLAHAKAASFKPLALWSSTFGAR
jgi:hypothetical protein